jgi:hypothetical protein
MEGLSKKFAPKLEEESDVRNSIGRYRGQTQRAFGLQFRFRDGRRSQGLSWAWYQGNDLMQGSESESLVLLFTHFAIEIFGQDLEVIIYALEEQDMKWLQELGTAEADKRVDMNRSLPMNERQPAIRKITIFPTIREAAKRLEEIPDEP